MKVVVCVTGASGAIYARRTLEVLTELGRGQPRRDAPEDIELHWVASENAEHIWRHELGEDMPGGPHAPHAARRWTRDDFSAPFASGSSAPDAVICVPCSMSTLARIAHGGGTGLIDRACEVALKERRPLVLVVREAPLGLVQLRNMVAATEAGAIVLPAAPSFYGGVSTLEQAVDTVIARALEHAGIRISLAPRWGNAPD